MESITILHYIVRDLGLFHLINLLYVGLFVLVLSDEDGNGWVRMRTVGLLYCTFAATCSRANQMSSMVQMGV